MNKNIRIAWMITLLSLLVAVTSQRTLGQDHSITQPPSHVQTINSSLAPGQSKLENLLTRITRDGVVLKAEGTQIEVIVDDIPTDAVVAGVDIKVSTDTESTPALDIQIAAPDTGKVKLPLGTGTVDGATKTIQTAHELDGARAQGTWTITLVPAEPALVGQSASMSLVVHYRATLTLPELRSGGEGAYPTVYRLPMPVWELSPSLSEDQDEKLSTTPGSTIAPAGWETIKYESFEGAFPNTGWALYDTNSDGYEYLWDDVSYKAFSGAWSAWPANGGTNGLSPATNNYPNNMDSWMIYGPFDLSNAVDAQTVFSLWRAIEPFYDYIFFGVSADGTNFGGYSWDGTTDWTQMTIGLADWVGDDTVWVGWYFHSDGSVVDKGPFVDEITISKNVQQGCGAPPLLSNDEQLEGKVTREINMLRPAVMPPHPDLLERARRGELTLPADVGLQQQNGINQPQQLAAPPQGNWNALALLVQFTDNPAQVGATDFDTLLFGGGFGTLTHYYNTVSYGILNIVTVNLPSSIGWCNMPQPYSYYVNGQNGFGAYPQNAQKLAEDAVLLADPLVDFSQYDNDGDSYVDTVFIIHAGQGAEFSGNSNHIWSHAWETNNDPVVDGVTFNSYTAEPEYWSSPGDVTVGVYAHELGHALGLPDLYDGDGSSHGLGVWSLMGSGSWNGPWPGGGSPAFLDAWSRAQLGFVTPIVVTNNTVGSSLPAAETSPTVYRLWTNGSSGPERFLVENRQQTSYDAALPGAGLLIWHIDQNASGNAAECRQLNNWLCGSNHYTVALEQADGLLDLENNIDPGDAGDPYPGSTNDRTFTFTSSPNSSSYASSTNTYIGVTNISNSGTTMTANFQVRSTSGNLLTNPSFELDANNDGKPDQWSTNNKFTRSNETPPVDGAYVGRFRATNNSGATIQQTVSSLTAGKSYTFSCSAKIPTTSDSFTFKFQVQWRRANNTTISTWTVKTYTDDTAGAWNRATGSQAAPTGTAKAQIKMVATSLNGTIYVDHCVFN